MLSDNLVNNPGLSWSSEWVETKQGLSNGAFPRLAESLVSSETGRFVHGIFFVR